MKLTYLTVVMVVGTITPLTLQAAGIDRSGQPISAFLQIGNYFEAGLSMLDPTIVGQEAGTSKTQRLISDMAEDYYFPSAALKLQLTDQISFGVLYDQPFGAKAAYKGRNNFVSSPKDPVLGNLPMTVGDLTNIIGGTEVEVNSQNISMILGFQPNKNLNIYGGGAYQSIRGDLHLRGSAYSIYNGYDATFHNDSAVGWLAGLAYQIPEIALKAAITYRSEIDHKIRTDETIKLANALTANVTALDKTLDQLATTGQLSSNQADAIQKTISDIVTANRQQGQSQITTPQSVNIDFQTGIMKNTVLFATMRWVDWKNFTIRPYKFGKVTEAVGSMTGKMNGFNLVEYSDDQWSANVGVGRKINEYWSGNLSIGWDSGAGNPITTLGPVNGYWNVGLGLQYSPTAQTFIAGGIKYFWLGNANAQSGSQFGTNDYIAQFEDNNAIAYGLKIGYRF
ncbi:outer membrane protein transport protein [Acinetobacter sichuanensis]|uniref:Outer membrane protein transport protein n=1 Tax=Acinetobacter sichuanensis TaxID=2136183 RepID=A0A371YR21_9GAMM|nr:outer membrane protein transport protein [Acinetobacter sichuanensis]RFC83905.1 transporter [Acinetobacter sichuanensis]